MKVAKKPFSKSDRVTQLFKVISQLISTKHIARFYCKEVNNLGRCGVGDDIIDRKVVILCNVEFFRTPMQRGLISSLSYSRARQFAVGL